MNTSEDGLYLSAVDTCDIVGAGAGTTVYFYLDPDAGELRLCAQPLEAWEKTINIPVVNNKELITALTEVLKKLNKEK